MASAQELHPDAISRACVGKLAVDGVFTLLSSVSVAVRFVQRRRIGQVWWDDWAVLGSLVFAFGIMVTAALIATIGGAGYHVTTYSRAQLETYAKICLANNVIYHVSIMLSKASVLFFYSCIFSVDVVVLRFMQVLGAVLVANCLAAVCGLIFSNSPVEGQWNLSMASTSIDAKPFWITMGVVNLVLDVVILAIPQSRVWKLKLSRQRKIALSLVFLLGCFVCVATTVWIVYIADIDVSDVTYTFTPRHLDLHRNQPGHHLCVPPGRLQPVPGWQAQKTHRA